jgi:hypothetical protein
MPCQYTRTANNRINYWEEAACNTTLYSNCYCYSVNRQNNGYCMPGTRSFSSDLDVSDCAAPYQGVIKDGGKPVTREQVYKTPNPPGGHYIALVVWPGMDFHFLRRDEDGSWSQKKGDTFVTNTYPDGRKVYDVEDIKLLGVYSHFCGYFLVNPATHFMYQTAYSAQDSLKRLEALKLLGGKVGVKVTPLSHPTWGWARQSYPYFLFGLDTAVWESGQRQMAWDAPSGTKLVRYNPKASKDNSRREIAPVKTGPLPRWASIVTKERATRFPY